MLIAVTIQPPGAAGGTPLFGLSTQIRLLFEMEGDDVKANTDWAYENAERWVESMLLKDWAVERANLVEAVELTTDELASVCAWGDYFVEWNEGKGSKIEQNQYGLETSSALHDKLTSALAERMQGRRRSYGNGDEHGMSIAQKCGAEEGGRGI